MLFQRLNVPSKLKAILEQGQVGDVSRRTGGVNFCDYGCQFVVLSGFAKRISKILEIPHGNSSRNARSSGDPFQIGPRTRSCWKTTHGEQALVVEDNVGQVVW